MAVSSLSSRKRLHRASTRSNSSLVASAAGASAVEMTTSVPMARKVVPIKSQHSALWSGQGVPTHRLHPPPESGLSPGEEAEAPG